MAEAELDQYESYAMGTDFFKDQDKQWVTFSSLQNNMVKNSIVYEFDTYGYEFKENDPDMIVNFEILAEVFYTSTVKMGQSHAPLR